MIQGAGEWIAAYPEQEKQQILQEEPELLQKWDSTYGDRMTEIVMIGIDMNQNEIEEALDKCLLTDQEMIEDWSAFYDPLPPFTVIE